MEPFVRRSAAFESLYNCSFYDVGSVPLEKRQNVLFGVLLIAIGAIEELLYLPCMVAIWRHSKHSCYKLMFFMGVLDILVLPIPSIASGYLAIVGAVYCSAPDLIYILGTISFSLWYTETSVEVVLAFNRCADVVWPDLSAKLFSSYRTWLWTIPPSLYGLFTFAFVPPGFFNGIYSFWLTNPHIGYAVEQDPNYKIWLLTVHNWLVIFSLGGIYLFLGIQILLLKSHHSQSTSHKMIFFQVLVISAINMIAASSNAAFDFVQIPTWMSAVTLLGWTQAHGIPPLIYLTMNKTIRKECVSMLQSMRRLFPQNGIQPTPTVVAVAPVTSNGRRQQMNK